MTTEQIELELPKLRSQTVAIAGKLKTLWRSLSIDDTGNEGDIFNQNLGDGGDSYIVETLINDVAILHKALLEHEQNLTISKPSIETISNTQDPNTLSEMDEIRAIADSLLIEVTKIKDEIKAQSKPKQTLKYKLNNLCAKYDIHEVLEDLTEIMTLQADLNESTEDEDNLRKIAEFLCEAQSLSELLSVQFQFN